MITLFENYKKPKIGEFVLDNEGDIGEIVYVWNFKKYRKNYFVDANFDYEDSPNSNVNVVPVDKDEVVFIGTLDEVEEYIKMNKETDKYNL